MMQAIQQFHIAYKMRLVQHLKGLRDLDCIGPKA